MSSLAGKKRKRKGTKNNVNDKVLQTSTRNQMATESLKETEVAHQVGDCFEGYSLKQVESVHTHEGNMLPYQAREFGKD